MISKGLADAAKRLCLTVEDGVAYGWYQGIPISLSEVDGRKHLCIYAGRDNPEEAEETGMFRETRADKIAGLIKSKVGLADADDNTAAYRIASVKVTNDSTVVQVSFYRTMFANDEIRLFVRKRLLDVAMCARVDSCAACGCELGNTVHAARVEGEAVVPLCGKCAGELESIWRSQREAIVYHTPRAVVCTILLMIAMVGLWMGFRIKAPALELDDRVAAIVGPMLCMLYDAVYRKLMGKRGARRVLTVFACAVLTVVIGEFAYCTRLLSPRHFYYMLQTAAKVKSPVNYIINMTVDKRWFGDAMQSVYMWFYKYAFLTNMGMIVYLSHKGDRPQRLLNGMF